MAMRANRRPGLTLVELIVVVAIIATLATITALYFPRFQEQEQVNRGADMLQGWLLIARQQARRDGVSTGLRVKAVPIIPPRKLPSNPNAGASESGNVVTILTSESHGARPGQWVDISGVADPTLLGADSPYNGVFQIVDVPTQNTFTYRNATAGLPDSGYGTVTFLGVFQYVQQPPNFAQGQYWRQFTNQARTAQFKYVNFFDPGTEVKPGDYIDIMGQMRRVSSVDSQTELSFTAESAPLPADPAPDNGPTGSPNYRVIPHPRPIPGEQELLMPDDIGISVADSLNPPTRFANGLRLIEVVFSPSGAVTGEGSRSGQVIFWVRHYAPNINGKTLITVQPRTGFIAAHPVASGNDPYLFTKDARSSGM